MIKRTALISAIVCLKLAFAWVAFSIFIRDLIIGLADLLADYYIE